MSMRIITGCTGTTHVTSNNDGEFNQAIFGDGLVVLSNGNKLSASVVNNNKITVKDGDLVLQGRHALIEPNTTQDVTIETGTVDMNRNDLIVAQYTLDASTGYEDIKLVVKKGTETSGTASDPSYTTGVIRTGAALVEAPLYRVKIEGISITALECLFTPIDNIIDGSSADKISYDNTESGMDATNVQDAIDECNENLTNYAVLYNPTDDYLYVGNKKWKYAGLNFNGVVLQDGTFNSAFSLSSVMVNYDVVSSAPFEYTNNQLSCSYPSTNKSKGSWIDGEIDLSNYTKLNVTYTANGVQATKSLTLSGRESGYIAMNVENIEGTKYLAFGIGSTIEQVAIQTYARPIAIVENLTGSAIYFNKIWFS